MPPRIIGDDGAVRLRYEERLIEIERLWLQDWSTPAIVKHLQGRTPLPACEACGAEEGKTVPTCRHGPYRWPSPQDPDRPISQRMVEHALQAVRLRLRHRAAQQREENRALFLARQDEIWRRAIRDGNLQLAYSASCRRADVDGTHVAAEEAQDPRLYDQVLGLAAQLVDYEPAAPEGQEGQLEPEAVRFWLLRARQLLLMASDSAARFRSLGRPGEMDEAKRRVWRRDVVDETLLQAATAPGLPAERRRDQVARLAGAAAYTTEDAEIAERLDGVLRKLRGTTGAT